MHLTLLIFCLCLAGSLAWLAPERCEQPKSKSRRSPRATRLVRRQSSPTSAKDLAVLQQAHLENSYKNYSFEGVPIRATCHTDRLEVYSAFNCKFFTYEPRVLSTVNCDKNCKLNHAESTTDSYTASEGYNWGVKIAPKVKLFEIFEIGGEASTGGTYSCTYTKGKTTTDSVECSADERGTLQLFRIRSDMICDFGPITLQQELRDDAYGAVADGAFTESDKKEISDHMASFFNCRFPTYAMVDTNMISDRLLEKIMDVFPFYNPYTDILTLEKNFVLVSYYTVNSTIYEFKKRIPFTNEGGDSESQYACVFTKKE